MKSAIVSLSVFLGLMVAPLLAQNDPFVIDEQPVNSTNVVGDYVEFDVDAIGGSWDYSYQWRKNGVPINDTSDGRISGTKDYSLEFYPVLSNDTGTYSVKVTDNETGQSLISSNAYLWVIVPPTITKQPLSRTNLQGTTATFTVQVTGTAPFTYQWDWYGDDIPNATNATLTLTNVQYPDDEGDYSVTVYNDSGYDYSAYSDPGTLTVWVPPVMVTQPESTTNLVGDDVELYAEVNDDADNYELTLIYQWRKKATNIPGETDEGTDCLLDVDDDGVATNDAAPYSVVFKSDAGAVTSAVANVTVLLDAEIVSDPQDQKVGTNKVVTFTAKAIGTPPLGYQWFFNDNPIPGAPNSNVYSFTVTNANQSGYYSVMVSNVLYFTVNDDSTPHDPVEEYDDTSDYAYLQVVAETVKPTLSITSPAEGAGWSNSPVIVSGTASDNAQVASVSYLVNGSEPSLASTSNGWTNWTATFIPIPGTNIFTAYAVDTSGNQSTNATRHIIYVLSDRLTLVTNPPAGGKVSGVAGGQSLQINNSYTATATANTTQGYVFTNWSGGTNIEMLAVLTNGPALHFTMESNLVLVATFVDTQKPTLAITNPVSGIRVSNAVVDIKGWAKDNDRVTNVWLSVGSGPFASATTGNNWSNWVATAQTLEPGTNLLRAYASDATGNQSLMVTSKVIYVVSGPLVVETVGRGTLSPDYSNAVLQIGNGYTMTATAASGFTFTNWSGSTNMGMLSVLTNKSALKFTMESNLVLVATFVDTQKPTLAITNPVSGIRVSNAVVDIKGWAKDNDRVTNVWLSVGSGPFASATTGNNWSNWVAGGQTLMPGTNLLRAYASDATGNQSLMVTSKVIYVVGGPLVVETVGRGTLSPNYSNAVLQIGNGYTMTATAASGFTFTNWSGGTDPGNLSVLTNKSALMFTMESNLVLVATFVDIQKPTIAITNPAANAKFTNTTVTVRGWAKDNGVVTQVLYQVNGIGPWANANTTNGWTNWWATVNAVTASTNTVTAYALDSYGNQSTNATLKFNYTGQFTPLVVQSSGQGIIDPDYNGQMLGIGQTYSMMATGTNGFVLTNWSGGTNLTLSVLTNEPTVVFLMQSNLILQADFADVQPPTVTITNSLPGGAVTSLGATVGGTASDNDRVTNVMFRLNGGNWTAANGTNVWSASLDLSWGTNVFEVYSLDAAGNASATNSVETVLIILKPTINGISGGHGGSMTIELDSVTGATYTLEYKNSLTNAVWTPISPPQDGTGGILSLTDTNAPSATRFYRIRAQITP